MGDVALVFRDRLHGSPRQVLMCGPVQSQQPGCFVVSAFVASSAY